MTFALALSLFGFLQVAAPDGWIAGISGTDAQDFDVQLDDKVMHEGRRSLRMTATQPHPRGDVRVMQAIRAEHFRGKRVKLTVYAKTENAGTAYLWLSNHDARGNVIQGDMMEGRMLRGTTPFTRYELVVDVGNNASQLHIGGVLSGGGSLWMDDLSLQEVDHNTPLTVRAQEVEVPTNLGFEN